MLIDSHAHLDMPQFGDDRHEVIRRAENSGVELMISIATGSPRRRSVEDTLELAERYDCIRAGIGISPHDARFAEDAYLDRLDAWAAHPKVVLWGEIGLDYYYDLSPREVFRRQLRLARRRNLPVSLHCRDAWDDLMAILREEYAGAGRGAILHSFAGNREQALEAVSLGLYLSFSGMLTFRNADALREAARVPPPELLLVETDCPYLAPVPHRGKRNEPAFLRDTAAALATLRGVELEALARATSANLRHLLQLPPSDPSASPGRES
jgi:TatD DNase family protein